MKINRSENKEEHSRLLDRKALGELHPALKNGYRVDYLVRIRSLPVVKIGRSIFFDEIEILNWIEDHKIQPKRGGKNDNGSNTK